MIDGSSTRVENTIKHRSRVGVSRHSRKFVC
jgi:hypothetical protein